MIAHSQINKKKVASDSDSNSDGEEENLDIAFQNKLKQRQSLNRGQKVQLTQCAKLALAMIIIGLVLAIMFLIHNLMIGLPQTKDVQLSKNGRQQNLQGFPHKDHTQRIKPEQNKQNNNQEKEQSLPLSSLSEIGLKNAFFFLDGSVQNKDINWYIKREAICIPNQKLIYKKTQDGLVLQYTPYQDVNLLTREALKQQDFYEMESTRQFAKNVSNYYPNITIVFDHHDPFLLVLIVRYFPKGIFVSRSENLNILQKNLILNDLKALVTVRDRKDILQDGQRQLIITSDPSLIADVLINSKKQNWILINFHQPYSVQAQIAAQINIYELLPGKQCEKRYIYSLQKNQFKDVQKSKILSGWHLFTPSFIKINFAREVFNYSAPLYNPKKAIQCEQFSSDSSHLKNNRIYVRKLPFKQHYFFSYDGRTSSGYRQVYGLIKKLNVSGKVYLQSGACQLLLIAISSFQNSVDIYLNPNYQERKLLIKNLVLNNQQKVKLLENQGQQHLLYSFIITNNHETIQKGQSEMFLFVSVQPVKTLVTYNYSLIVSQQCAFPIFRKEGWQMLPEGLFLVKKS